MTNEDRTHRRIKSFIKMSQYIHSFFLPFKFDQRLKEVQNLNLRNLKTIKGVHVYLRLKLKVLLCLKYQPSKETKRLSLQTSYFYSKVYIQVIKKECTLSTEDIRLTIWIHNHYLLSLDSVIISLFDIKFKRRQVTNAGYKLCD